MRTLASDRTRSCSMMQRRPHCSSRCIQHGCSVMDQISEISAAIGLEFAKAKACVFCICEMESQFISTPCRSALLKLLLPLSSPAFGFAVHQWYQRRYVCRSVISFVCERGGYNSCYDMRHYQHHKHHSFIPRTWKTGAPV